MWIHSTMKKQRVVQEYSNMRTTICEINYQLSAMFKNFHFWIKHQWSFDNYLQLEDEKNIYNYKIAYAVEFDVVMAKTSIVVLFFV